MRALRVGMHGNDVTAWSNFLLGQGFLKGPVNDQFDDRVAAATREFQKRSGAAGDGVVGTETFRAAMYLGYDPIDHTDLDYQDLNWPPPPAHLSPVMSLTTRQQMFGTFTYVPAPTEQNPEAIRITNDWETKNIVTVTCPQLVPVNPSGKVRLHRLAAPLFLELWSRWEKAGLLHLVLVWNGAYAPRFVRGSTTNVSNHAFGSAFDINAAWNKLGSMPAARGAKGCVRELVPIANELGWYWGGHYKNRADGMHFELVKLP